MEESIVKAIAAAEEEASRIKTEGAERAAEIVRGAEEEAARIRREGEAEAARLGKEGVCAAERSAQEDYERAIGKRSAEARRYADGLIETADPYVSEILGRLLK